MIVSYINKINELLSLERSDHFDKNLYVFLNQLEQNLSIVITHYSLEKDNQIFNFYTHSKCRSLITYKKLINKNKIVFEYSTPENMNSKTTYALLDYIAIILNEWSELFLLKENYENILRDQKEERSSLLSMFCHDLANPLSIINMSIEFIEDADIKNQFTPITNRIKKSGESILNIIKSIRELNALKSGKKILHLEPISLNQVFIEFKEKYKQNILDKNITLILSTPNAKDIEFIADRHTFINYVLNNLISNSLKYSRENSKIEILAKKNNEKIDISIIDYGIGMSEQQVTRIFKFDKTQQRLGTHGETGEGIGLQFCRYALLLHGFKLHIASQQSNDEKENGGTTVTLTIPMSA